MSEAITPEYIQQLKDEMARLTDSHPVAVLPPVKIKRNPAWRRHKPKREQGTITVFVEKA